MLILKCFLAFLLCLPMMCQTREHSVVETKENVTSEENHKNLTVLEKWEFLENKVKNFIKQGIKAALPMLMESSGKLNMSKECLRSSLHLISGLKELKPWAFQFLDSSGKTFDGLFTASVSSFGQYDECMDIQVKSTKLRDKGKPLFGGQYCLVDMKLPLPPRPKVLSFKIPEMFQNFSRKDTILAKAAEYVNAFYSQALRLGICIPSTCSEDDLSKVVSLLGNEFYLNTSVYRCEVKEKNEFTPAAIGVITSYSLIGGLVLVATLIEAFVSDSDVVFKSKAMQALLAFSLFTNYKKFSKVSSKPNSLRCFQGVRFIAMLWVITLHTYIEALEVNLHGGLYALDKIKDFKFQVILNGVLTVDTFFFMGGFLVANITIKLFKNQVHKFNAVKFIIFRILRILPAYMFVIMFGSLMPMMGSGPVWHSKAYSYYEPCPKYWWTNILFINNFYSFKYSCFPTTWYVAADFQLYVFSLVIIIPLLRWPKIGISAGVITVLASIIYSGVKTYIKEYPPAVVFYLYDKEGILNYLDNFNFTPFVHAGPYAIGVLAGYLLAIKPEIKISPFLRALGWTVAFAAGFSIIFGTADWYKALEAPLVPSIIYSSVKRTVWTLAIAWIIMCCAIGYGGIINDILCLDIFVPLGRLTFLAYLIHPIVQMIVHGNSRVRAMPVYYSAVYIVLGHSFVSYAFSFIVHLVVEVPFANLVTIFFNKANREKEFCKDEKDKDFLETNIDGEKKEDIVAVTFVSEEKSNGTYHNPVASNNL